MKISNLKVLNKIIITFCLQSLFILTITTVYAQAENVVAPYKIGDQVQRFRSDNVISHTIGSIDLNDYKGKAVILDFWATWCKPCIASFPKLEKLHHQYAEKLGVILLSPDSEESIKGFYHNRPKFGLHTIVMNSGDSLKQRFPYVFVPHYVWLDAQHRLYAITDETQLTEGNIEKLIRGLKPTMQGKDDELELMDLQGMPVDSIDVDEHKTRSISIDSNLMYGSQITRYDWRVSGYIRFSNVKNKKGFLESTNTSVSDLFRLAYFGFRRDKLDRELFVVDHPDSNLIYPDTDDRELLSKWQRKHAYSYRLFLPPHMADSAKRYEYMQRDLENYFGLAARYEQRELDCVVLRCTNPDLLKTTGGKPKQVVKYLEEVVLINQPVDKLLFTLRTYGINYSANSLKKWMPLIDETGIDFNIDLDLNQVANRDQLTKELAKNGLEISFERRMVKALVLK